MDTGRIGSRGTSAGVGGARERRRSVTGSGPEDEERGRGIDERRHRDLVRLDGVVFDRNAPRGTYLNIVI